MTCKEMSSAPLYLLKMRCHLPQAEKEEKPKAHLEKAQEYSSIKTYYMQDLNLLCLQSRPDPTEEPFIDPFNMRAEAF